MFRLYHIIVAYKIKNEDWIKRQQFNYNSNVLLNPNIQSNRCQCFDMPRDSCDVCFRTFALMTQVSGVDDNFIN